MLGRSGLGDCMVYLQVTRGVAKRDHGFPKNCEHTIFCMVSPFKRPDAHHREQGLSVKSSPDIRWLHCEIKSVSLWGNVLANQAAVEAGARKGDGVGKRGSDCAVLGVWTTYKKKKYK